MNLIAFKLNPPEKVHILIKVQGSLLAPARMSTFRPLFKTKAALHSSASSAAEAAAATTPFVYRLHDASDSAVAVGLTARDATTTPAGLSSSLSSSEVASSAPTTAPTTTSSDCPDMYEEQRKKYMVDLSQSYMPANPYLKSLSTLDVIAARQPALSDSVKRHLWTPFVPDAFAPTEFLKDVPPPYGPKPKRFLDLKNAHPLDDRVVFIGGLDGIDAAAKDDAGLIVKEEPHRYYIDGSCANIISVTTFLKAFFEPFDAVKQSESTFRTKTFADCKHRPNYKYYGCKSPEDIQAIWKRSGRLGTMMHANLEAHFNGEPFVVAPENQKPFQQFQDLFKDTAWVAWESFRTEWSVFDRETMLAGQIDLVGMLNRERAEIVLIDWKRCENISDTSFARWAGGARDVAGFNGKGPCSGLENCNYVHYSLQLNIYAYLLWKNYGLTTKKMFILQFHPKNKNNLAGVYQVPTLTSVVEEMMAQRKIVLRLNGVAV